MTEPTAAAAVDAVPGPGSTPADPRSSKRRRVSTDAAAEDGSAEGEMELVTSPEPATTEPPLWHHAVLDALEPQTHRTPSFGAAGLPPFVLPDIATVGIAELETLLPSNLTMPKWYAFKASILDYYAPTCRNISRFAFNRLRELLHSRVASATTTAGFPCATLAQLALFDPTLCRHVSDIISEKLPRFDAETGRLLQDCAEVAIVVLSMFHKPRADGAPVADTVRCAKILAKPLLSVVRKLLRDDLVNLAKLREFSSPPIGSAVLPWPLHHVMDEVAYELRKAAELLYITSRNQLFPIFWTFRPPIRFYSVDARGFYRQALLYPSYDLSESKEYALLLASFARCLPPPCGAETPDGLRLQLLQSNQIIFTAHLLWLRMNPSDQRMPLHQGLEDVIVDIVTSLIINPPEDPVAEQCRWNVVCDALVLNTLPSTRSIVSQRFVRSVLTRVAREAPGLKSRRFVWLVLQLVFGDRNFLRADWEESHRSGQRTLIDALADVYEPASSDHVSAADLTRPWCAVDLAMACLLNRASLTSFIDSTQIMTTKLGPHLERDLRLLSSVLERSDSVIDQADCADLSIQSFQRFVLSASAVSSEKVTAELFLQQRGKLAEEKIAPLHLSGGFTHVSSFPLRVDWIDEMPVWSRIRFQISFLDLLADQEQQVVAPGALETFARIRYSIPMTSVFNVANSNFFVGLLAHLQTYIKEQERVRSRRAVHAMLEILGFRMIHLLPFEKKTPMMWIGVLLGCLNSTNDRQLHTMLHCVFIKVLAVVSAEPIMFQSSVSKATGMIPKSDERLARMFILCMCRSHRLSLQPPNNDAFVVVVTTIDSIISLQWSANAMRHFPEPIRDFYTAKGAGPAISAAHIAMQDQVAKIAQDPLAQALYDKRQAELWPKAKAMFLKDDNRPLFFCIFLYFMGKDPDLERVYDVMKGIPLQELSTCVSNMTDYTVRVLNRTGTQFEDYVVHFMRMMENVIWKYRLFSVDDVILSLIRENPHEDGEPPKRVRLVRELLFDTNSANLQTIVRDFVVKMTGAGEPAKCQTWHHQHSEHVKANSAFYQDPSPFQLIGGEGRTLPEYMGTLCLRLIPTLDRVINWILDHDPRECDQAKFLASILDTYGGLFDHHLTPLTVLHEQLLAHHEILVDQPDVLRRLVLLYAGHRSSIWESHPKFREYIEARTECEPADVARGIISSLRMVAADPTCKDCRYNEHLTPVLQTVRESAIRLLSSPAVVLSRSLELIVDALIDLPDSSTMTVFGSLLLGMPVHYRDIFDDMITKVLTEDWCYGAYTPSISFHARYDARGSVFPRVLCELIHACWLPDKWKHVLLPQTMQKIAPALSRVGCIQQLKFFAHCFGSFTALFTVAPGNEDACLKVLDSFCTIPDAVFTHACSSDRVFDTDGARSILTYIRLFIAGVGDAARKHEGIQQFLQRVESLMDEDRVSI